MDHYHFFEIERNASQKEIKQVYRKLALKYHPDVNKSPDAECLFKKLQKIYEVLCVPHSRKKYDKTLPPIVKKKKRSFHEKWSIKDAPPPKFDLWGKPIKSKENWYDVFKTAYEKDVPPDIR